MMSDTTATSGTQPPADNCRNCSHTKDCRFYYDRIADLVTL
jgi:hypothetical protein